MARPTQHDRILDPTLAAQLALPGHELKHAVALEHEADLADRDAAFWHADGDEPRAACCRIVAAALRQAAATLRPT